MVKTKTIRVMIVDDHDIVRNGLKFMLEAHEDLEFAGEAATGERAVSTCGEIAPDVILMDLILPGINGVETIRRLHQQHPDIRIIALTSYDENDLVKEALQAGAMSYMKKNVSIKELVGAIRDAFMGRPTLSSEAAQILIASTRQSPQIGEDLTDRELAVLGLLVQGYSNNQIADDMVISRSTVKHHVSSILAKLQVKNRAGAVAIALEKNLVKY